jgi:hypothetical protein
MKTVIKKPRKTAKKIEIKSGLTLDHPDAISTSSVIELIVPNADIFRVHIFGKNGNISAIYIFSGGAVLPLISLFSELEVSYINAYVKLENIHFSKFQIHRDDSINMIKRKIINEIGASKTSYEELYLFSNIKETVDLVDIYQRVTKHESIPFSDIQFQQFKNCFINNDEPYKGGEEKKDNYK